ncbi:helix-turn-helix transcriptional regulator [Paenarthrobacter sp. NPDC057355]|uniref:helix-turn-helix transcriptional regulator n=1 Tax=Paenarthrobacter sp. NPDC057355 TaxID=3346105 RepID=UPI0036379203
MTEVPKLRTIAEVSEMTRIPVNTLRYYRHLGKGPKAAKCGGRVMYRESDVIDWINAAFESAA